MTELLVAEGLELAYGEVPACRGIVFHVDQGEIVTLIGANGAGKSTTLRAIAGALIPRAGVIRFRGQNITRLPSYERTRLGIALVPEGRRVFPFLTARENLELGAFKYRNDKPKVSTLLDKIFAMFPRLSERSSQNAGTLSGGEQQMLALGRAMMSEPYLLCLDEPSLGLAPLLVKAVFEMLLSLRSRGYTILLVEQNALQVLEFVDRAYVIRNGEIKMEASAEGMQDEKKLLQAYLGVGD